jgi:hypothetical protein
MNTNNRPYHKAENSARAPQLRVRCDVRAGDDLSTCQWNLTKWQQRYQDAYAKARAQGCI